MHYSLPKMHANGKLVYNLMKKPLLRQDEWFKLDWDWHFFKWHFTVNLTAAQSPSADRSICHTRSQSDRRWLQAKLSAIDGNVFYIWQFGLLRAISFTARLWQQRWKDADPNTCEQSSRDDNGNCGTNYASGIDPPAWLHLCQVLLGVS